MILKKGNKLKWKEMVMVITGETKTSYLGYHEYKGKPAEKCSILKETLNNPHYTKNLKYVLIK